MDAQDAWEVGAIVPALPLLFHSSVIVHVCSQAVHRQPYSHSSPASYLSLARRLTAARACPCRAELSAGDAEARGRRAGMSDAASYRHPCLPGAAARFIIPTDYNVGL